MIDNVIYQILAATHAITVTNGVGTNIFTAVAAQGDLSTYIVIHLIDIVPENTKDGASMTDEARVQIDSFHADKAAGDTLAGAIRTALDRYRGKVGSITIDKIIFDNARNDYDYERNVYKVSQDYIIRQKR